MRKMTYLSKEVLHQGAVFLEEVADQEGTH
jgi:hypothetical protein